MDKPDKNESLAEMFESRARLSTELADLAEQGEQGPASNQQVEGHLLDRGSKLVQELAQSLKQVSELALSCQQVNVYTCSNPEQVIAQLAEAESKLQQALGQIKQPLVRLSRSYGGYERAKSLSPERRTEISLQGVAAKRRKRAARRDKTIGFRSDGMPD